MVRRCGRRVVERKYASGWRGIRVFVKGSMSCDGREGALEFTEQCLGGSPYMHLGVNGCPSKWSSIGHAQISGGISRCKRRSPVWYPNRSSRRSYLKPRTTDSTARSYLPAVICCISASVGTWSNTGRTLQINNCGI